MTSISERQKALRERIRASAEQQEFEEFMIATPFTSKTTDDEKYAIFLSLREIGKFEQQKRKILAELETTSDKFTLPKLLKLYNKTNLRKQRKATREKYKLNKHLQDEKKGLQNRSTESPHERLALNVLVMEASDGKLSAQLHKDIQSDIGQGSTCKGDIGGKFESDEWMLEQQSLDDGQLHNLQGCPKKIDMASSSKDAVDPYQVNAEALEEQRRQLRCINRRCSYGDTLINAVELVCTYYHVDYKPGREVCTTCFTKCLEHYKYLEMKWKEGKCIMDTSFPSYDSFVVIEDSSSDEEGDERKELEKEEEPQPSTSKEGSTPHQDVKNAINSAIIHYFNENKYLFEHQVKLCDEFIDEGINQCLVDADALDKLASDLEDEMESLRNELYCPYQPVITSLEPVDINELEENIEKEQEVEMRQEQINMPIKKVKTPIEKVMMPIKEVKTPIEKVLMPIKEVKTPIEKVMMPIKEVKTPIEKVMMPIKEVKTPIENVKMPIKEVKTPIEKVKMPIKEVKTPIENVKMPIKEVKTPIEKVKMPIKEVKTSIEKIKMPIEVVKTSKDAKRFKLDVSDKYDKDAFITIDRTVCVVPANLPQVGLLQYPFVETGQIVYAIKFTVKDPWYRSKIKTVIDEDHIHVLFQTGEKIVSSKEIAYSTLNSVRFPVGCRVIAKLTDPNSKRIDEFYAGIVAESPKLLNKFRYLIFFDNGYFQYRQHQDIRLVVCKTTRNTVWKNVDESCSEFIKSYFDKYPERLMVKLTKKHSLRAEYHNQWQMAKVLEVDASLFKLYFADFKHSEWIYRGSPRLYIIFEKQSKSEKGIRLRQSGLAHLKKPFVEYTSVEEEPSRVSAKAVARKSTSKSSTTPGDGTQKCNKEMDNSTTVVIKNVPENLLRPHNFTLHKCSTSCISWTGYSHRRTKNIGMLTIPLHFGFIRFVTMFNESQKCVMYKSPCGLTIRSLRQMLNYLANTKSTMTIDQFDFNSWVKPFAEFKVLKFNKFIEDISEGKEFRGISCVNTINDTLPPKMDYMTTRRAMPGVNINVESEFLCGCDCTDNCQDKSKCACWQMTIEGQKILPNLYKDPNIGYNYRRLPERVLTGIYECNTTCKCSSSCLNRVVQNPLSQKLQLFMTEKKGWGVRCLNDIPQGAFICIYVGYLLTETDANEGGKNYGDEYLAELDYIEVVEKIKEDYESDIPFSDQENETEMNQSESSDEDYPCTSDGRRSEMTLKLRKRKKSKTKKDGKHVQVPSKLNARDLKNNPEPSKSMREYFGNNESVYIMDAKTSGNIGRYLNHSCSPNTFVQNVFVDTHDLRFPWVSFFALHYIQAGTELTWDYSYDIGSVPGKNMKCHCESVYCRGRLL